ncbi:MAG: hypothetical protein C0602_01575 [Denitrovibrio sp.]|nr:MAG: hypothetical protein C0602_01575 [Denitrovibrio sp.]
MKKYFPLIAILFIAAAIFISVIPDYKESKRPFNKLVTFSKAEGFALGVLLPDANMEFNASKEVVRLGEMVDRFIPTQYFSGADAVSISREQGISVPGYLLLDGDGNVVVRVSDVLRAEDLTKYFQDLHTH